MKPLFGGSGSWFVTLSRWSAVLLLSERDLQENRNLTVHRATLALGEGNDPSMNVVRNPERQLHVSIHTIAMTITYPELCH